MKTRKVQRKIAFCWRTGEIEIGVKVPEGAIPLAWGPEELLAAAVKRTSRLAADNKTPLVPGVPEASTSDAALDALAAYAKRLVEEMGGER